MICFHEQRIVSDGGRLLSFLGGGEDGPRTSMLAWLIRIADVCGVQYNHFGLTALKAGELRYGSRTKKIYQQTNKWSTLASSWTNCPKKAMNPVDHLRQLVQEDTKLLHSLRHGSGMNNRGAQFRRARVNIERNRTAGDGCPGSGRRTQRNCACGVGIDGRTPAGK